MPDEWLGVARGKIRSLMLMPSMRRFPRSEVKERLAKENFPLEYHAVVLGGYEEPNHNPSVAWLIMR